MAIDTNLNTSPYYDDFDENKDFHRVLFKPAVPVQARELTQLQTILQQQIERIGEFTFKEGSIVKGCCFNFDRQINYIKLLDKRVDGQDLNVGEAAANSYLVGSANVVAQLQDSSDGFESTNPDLKTFYFKYIGAQVANNTQTYANAEIVTVYDEGTAINAVTIAAGGSGYANGDTFTSNSVTGSGLSGNVSTNSTGGITSVSISNYGNNYSAREWILQSIPTVITTTSGTSANLFVSALKRNFQVTVANNDFTAPTGNSYSFRVDDGVVYQKGNFVRVDNQSIIVEKYNSAPHNKAVGFDIVESFVNSNSDATLLDNASGFSNENAPGADRLKLTPVLVVNTVANIDAANTQSKLVQFEAGQPVVINQDPELDKLGDIIGKQIEETEGDYVVNPFTVVSESLNSTSQSVSISSGVGYVKGRRFEYRDTTRKAVSKGLDTANTPGEEVTLGYGTYYKVNEVLGNPGINGKTVRLIDTAFNTFSSTNYTIPTSNTTTAQNGTTTGNVIGTAKIRNFKYETGLRGAANGQYKAYIYDIQMNANKKPSQVKAITVDNTTPFIADTVLTNGVPVIHETNQPSVFRTGHKAVKSIASGLSFPYRRVKDITIAQNGNNASFTDANAASFVYTGSINETGENDFIIVANSSVRANTVTTGSATHDGSTTNPAPSTSKITATGAFGSISAGDTVYLEGASANCYRKVIQRPNTSIIVVEPGVNTDIVEATSIDVRKAYVKGEIVDTGASGAEISENSGTVTVNIPFHAHAATKFNVHYSAKASTTGKTKELYSNAIVQIQGTANPPKSLRLGVVDVKKLKAVYIDYSSFVNPHSVSGNTNHVNEFILNDGQQPHEYEHSSISLKPGSSLVINSTAKVTAMFDVYKHSDSSGFGYFKVDSYPANASLTTANATHHPVEEIPVFKQRNKEPIDLRNSIDLRPSRANTVAYTNVFASANTVSLTDKGDVDYLSGGTELMFGDVNQNFSGEVQAYLGRIDRLVLGSEGGFKVIKGLPSENPVPPKTKDGTMDISIINIPPFPSLDAVTSRTAGRPDLGIRLNNKQVQRLTQKQINSIDKRLSKLEYYTSLNLLEKASNDLVIKSSANTSLDRFKNGMFVDNFENLSLANPLDPESKVGHDKARKTIQAKFDTYNINIVKNNTNNIRQTGDLYTIDYKQGVLGQQLQATTSRVCTGKFWDYRGDMKLYPDYDNHVETRTNPAGALNLDIDLAGPTLQLVDQLNQIAPTQMTSQEVINETTDSSFSSVTEGLTTTDTTTTTTTTETLIKSPQFNATTQTNEMKVGDFVTDIAFIPFIREQEIYFSINGLQPNQKHYFFFDETDVTNKIRPGKIDGDEPTGTSNARDRITLTGSTGQTFLSSDANGQLAGSFFLPRDTFFVGDRKFFVMSESTLANKAEAISRAAGTFHGFNYSVQKDTLNLNTRTVELSTEWQTSTVEDIVTTSNTEVTTEDPPADSSDPDTDTDSGSDVSGGGDDTSNPPPFEDVFDFDIADFDFDFLDFEFGGFFGDPMAQTFAIDPKQVAYNGGTYLSSMDLFFAEKDDQLGVTLEIREVSNGYPAAKVLPFGKKHLKSSQVNTSTDGSSATTFNFVSPIFLKTGKEYCFVIKPDGNSPMYKSFISRVGGTDLQTGKPVNSDTLGTGILFLSTNDKSWEPYLDEDVKYKLRGTVFQKSAGVATFTNDDYEFLGCNNYTGTLQNGEMVFQQPAAGFTANSSFSGNTAAACKLTTSSTNTTITAASNAEFTTKISNGDFIALVANGVNQDDYDVVQVKTVNSDTQITLKDFPQFSDANTRYFVCLTGKVDLNDTDNKEVVLNGSSATTGSNKFVAGARIIGAVSNGSANVISINDKEISYYEPRIYRTEPDRTAVAGSIKLSGTGSKFEKTKFNDRNFLGYTGSIKSKSNENGTKSLNYDLTLTTNSRHSSPALDDQSTSLLVYKSLGGNDSANEWKSGQGSQGNADTKYIGRTVNLKDGLDAEDLRVFATAYQPPGTKVEAYARIRNESDPNPFEEREWTELKLVNDETFSSPGDRNSFVELEFGIPSTHVANTTALSGVATTNNSSVIATTEDHNAVAAGTLVYIDGGTDTSYQISRVASANSTTITLEEDVTLANNEYKIATVDSTHEFQGFLDPQSSTAGIASYYNSDGTKYETFKDFAIKLVIKSDAGHKHPIVKDLRAIALSI